MSRTLRAFALLISLIAVGPWPQAASQQQQTPPFDRDSRRRDPEVERIEREQERARNKARQDDLKKDTDRLLLLATQLKQYVDKTNEHVLSLEVVKKAEEIEKLAHSVKDKMKAE